MFHPERCYDGLCEFEEATDTTAATIILVGAGVMVVGGLGWLVWRLTHKHKRK